MVIAGLVSVVTFAIGKSLFDEDKHLIGWLAVLFLLGNFAWTMQPAFLLTEPLFTLFLVAAIGRALLWKPMDWRFLALSGALLGLAWLTRGALIGVACVTFSPTSGGALASSVWLGLVQS